MTNFRTTWDEQQPRYCHSSGLSYPSNVQFAAPGIGISLHYVSPLVGNMNFASPLDQDDERGHLAAKHLCIVTHGICGLAK